MSLQAPPTPPTATAASPMILCAGCGYDLRGIESDRCPECGLAIDRAAALVSNIPWEHRKKIGGWRGYWKTMLLAMFRPRVLSRELARPVSFEAARRFNRRTIWGAWATPALLIIWTWAATMRLPVIFRPSDPNMTSWRWSYGMGYLRQYAEPSVARFLQLEPGRILSVGFALEVTIICVLLAAVWLAIAGAIRVGSYFFHPRRLPIVQQNRAVALSYYCCAPLAWTPLLLPLAGYTYWWYALTPIPGLTYARNPFGTAVALKALVAAGMALAVWVIVLHAVMLKHTTQCGPGRVIALVTALPVMWMVLAAVALSLPVIAYVLAIIGLSLVP